LSAGKNTIKRLAEKHKPPATATKTEHNNKRKRIQRAQDYASINKKNQQPF